MLAHRTKYGIKPSYILFFLSGADRNILSKKTMYQLGVNLIVRGLLRTFRCPGKVVKKGIRF